MIVSKLIEALKTMPPDAQVMHLWDGSARTQIQHVWLSKGGEVVTADEDEVCYIDSHRPVGSPNEIEQPYWTTPKV